MKLDGDSRRLIGITRAKGKMFEFGVPEEFHLAVPDGDEPDAVLLTAIGTLGDVAALIADFGVEELPTELAVQLGLVAGYFDAFLASRFDGALPRDLVLLASASYYLAGRPGSSAVMAKRLDEYADGGPIEQALKWVLQARFEAEIEFSSVHPYAVELSAISTELADHFLHGGTPELAIESLGRLRTRAYRVGNPRELLFADLIAAVAGARLSSSVWETIPSFSGLPMEVWRPVLERSRFPRELWPAQILIGQAGLFGGRSGIVQMPTSAGKTRSVEIVIRSAFLSKRTRLAIVVAPFRALSHEIGASLRGAFRGDDVRINELSDALQLDFDDVLSAFFVQERLDTKTVLVLTPEKLLFLLRQVPELVSQIGLVVYDEGHQFDSGSRGVTYELLLTEIKAVLSEATQTVLVSAVMNNAGTIGRWLLGDEAKLVDGAGLLPTARAVAFATWLDRRGRLMFFETDEFSEPDYFVPRVIEQQPLALVGRETKVRSFPEKGANEAWKDVSLYLGIRLAPRGAVAIFCGRKDTASGLARRASEVFDRGLALDSPAQFSDAAEIAKLRHLIDMHYGQDSYQSKAAGHGVFVHHGTTPNGLRLSIEFAMQHELIRLVVCTSTLAQGVNLPIRYLIVSGIRQSKENIRVRDFQNLMGRAGRSGMHTEGLIIFANPDLYDRRFARSLQYDAATQLLSAKNSEDIASSLLGVLEPLMEDNADEYLAISPMHLAELLVSSRDLWPSWAEQVTQGTAVQLDSADLIKELSRRRVLLESVESHLMANRGEQDFQEFRSVVRNLCEETLAYHLGTTEQERALEVLFDGLANHVQQIQPDATRQSRYAKTLLSVDNARFIEQWVDANRASLALISTSRLWLVAIWPLFAALSDSAFFRDSESGDAVLELAALWLGGGSYREIRELARTREVTKPWGAAKRRSVTEEDVFSFCEQTLSYECALYVAAVAQFLGLDDDSAITEFQKCLKYGLPDALASALYESGIPDRAIVLEIRARLEADGFSGETLEEVREFGSDTIADVLSALPSYFERAYSDGVK